MTERTGTPRVRSRSIGDEGGRPGVNFALSSTDKSKVRRKSVGDKQGPGVSSAIHVKQSRFKRFLQWCRKQDNKTTDFVDKITPTISKIKTFAKENGVNNSELVFVPLAVILYNGLIIYFNLINALFGAPAIAVILVPFVILPISTVFMSMMSTSARLITFSPLVVFALEKLFTHAHQLFPAVLSSSSAVSFCVILVYAAVTAVQAIFEQQVFNAKVGKNVAQDKDAEKITDTVPNMRVAFNKLNQYGVAKLLECLSMENGERKNTLGTFLSKFKEKIAADAVAVNRALPSTEKPITEHGLFAVIYDLHVINRGDFTAYINANSNIYTDVLRKVILSAIKEDVSGIKSFTIDVAPGDPLKPSEIEALKYIYLAVIVAAQYCSNREKQGKLNDVKSALETLLRQINQENAEKFIQQIKGNLNDGYAKFLLKNNNVYEENMQIIADHMKTKKVLLKALNSTSVKASKEETKKLRIVACTLEVLKFALIWLVLPSGIPMILPLLILAYILDANVFNTLKSGNLTLAKKYALLSIPTIGVLGSKLFYLGLKDLFLSRPITMLLGTLSIGSLLLACRKKLKANLTINNSMLATALVTSLVSSIGLAFNWNNCVGIINYSTAFLVQNITAVALVAAPMLIPILSMFSNNALALANAIISGLLTVLSSFAFDKDNTNYANFLSRNFVFKEHEVQPWLLSLSFYLLTLTSLNVVKQDPSSKQWVSSGAVKSLVRGIILGSLYVMSGLDTLVINPLYSATVLAGIVMLPLIVVTQQHANVIDTMQKVAEEEHKKAQDNKKALDNKAPASEVARKPAVEFSRNAQSAAADDAEHKAGVESTNTRGAGAGLRS